MAGLARGKTGGPRDKEPYPSRPNFNEGPIPLGYWRERTWVQLTQILAQQGNPKRVFLDVETAGLLDLLKSKDRTLQAHGVHFQHSLEAETSEAEVAVPTDDVPNCVYICRPSVVNGQRILRHVRAMQKVDPKAYTFHVICVPQRSCVMERVLEHGGALADLTLHALPAEFVPVEVGVLSMALPNVVRDVALEGDTSCWLQVARALVGLQYQLGVFPQVKAVGRGAVAVQAHIGWLWSEAGSHVPSVPAKVDGLVLIDRLVDLPSVMMTQMTYAGLAAEIVGVKEQGMLEKDDYAVGSSFEFTKPAQRRQFNTGEPVLKEIFHLRFDKAFEVGRTQLLRGRASWAEKKKDVHALATKAGVAEIAREQALLGSSEKQTALSCYLVARAKPLVQKIEREASAFSSGYADSVCAGLSTMMLSGYDVYQVMRLMCVLSATYGIPDRKWNALQRQLLQAYGHEHILTLNALQEAGLLRTASQWGGARRKDFDRLCDRLDLREDSSRRERRAAIHHVFGQGGDGIAPLSARLVEAAVLGEWRSLGDAGLLHLAGDHQEILQEVEEGAVRHINKGARVKVASTSNRRPVVMVMYIGGVTYAEIAALKALEEPCNVSFIVATTKVLTGTTLIKSFENTAIQNLTKMKPHLL